MTVIIYYVYLYKVIVIITIVIYYDDCLYKVIVIMTVVICYDDYLYKVIGITQPGKDPNPESGRPGV